MKRILLPFCWFLLQSAAQAQELQSRIAAEIEHFAPDYFMGSVLVTQADNILYSGQSGYSDIETAIELDQDSIFRIASLTKQFTSAAILLLEEQGLLSTEDSITTHLNGLPNFLSDVSLLHLLSHTSGISEIPNSAFNSDGNRSLELSETEYESIELESTPGERSRYSNSGYHLLGELIEAASGMTYSEFVSKNILEPLQLEQTGFTSAIPDSVVTGYFPDNGTLIAQEISDTEILGPHSAGGMYSNAADLKKWTEALFSGEVLSQDSMDKMKTIQRDYYALGLLITNENGRQRIYNTGSLFGFASSLSYFPESDFTIIVLSNINDRDGGGDAEIIAKSIEYILFEDHVLLPSQTTEIELLQSTLENFVGEYSIQPGGGLTVLLEEDHLALQFSGNSNKYELLPLSANTFHVGFPFIHYEFIQNEEGRYSALVLHQRGNEFMFTRQ